MDKTKSENKRSVSIRWIIYFFLGFEIADFVLFPTLLDKVFGPFLLTGNYSDTSYRNDEVILSLLKRTDSFMNWRWCVSSYGHLLITIGWHVMLCGLLIALYSSAHKGSSANGTEHGSARLLSDAEFDDLLPHYYFRKDEYNYERESDEVKVNELASSETDIFLKLDFEKGDK